MKRKDEHLPFILHPSAFILTLMRWFISIRYFLTHKRQSLVCIAAIRVALDLSSGILQGGTFIHRSLVWLVNRPGIADQ